MNRRLPPLKSLVVFESVVRLGSVTAAAEELCVTHGAVSKQVAALEEWFGRPLFGANRKQMRPTPEALDLAKVAGEALDMLDAAAASTQRGERSRPLRVIAPSTFAARWLIPRIWSFSEEHQEIAVQVRHTDSNEAWQDIPFDIAIRTSGEFGPHVVGRPIFEERLTLAISAPRPEAARLWRPADLRDMRLLSAATREGELERWLNAAGVERAGLRVTTFPHFYLALEAALAGAGPLVCPRETLGDLVQRGDLIEPWPQITVPGPTYVALCRTESAGDAAVEAFMGWLSRNKPSMAPTARSVIPGSGGL